MSLVTRIDNIFEKMGRLSKGQREDLRDSFKSTNLPSLSAAEITALPNNTLYLDGSNVLQWKNNSGVSKTVTIAV